MNLFLIITVLLFVINIFLALILIFIERRNPPTTWAWLMVFILMPGLGFLLYLFLGQNLSKQKMFDLKIIKDNFEKKLLSEQKKIYNESFKFNDPNVSNYSDMIHMHYVNSQSLFTQNNSVNIYIKGEDKFEALISDIQSAKEFIHLIYYIIKPDDIGNKIIKLLSEKAKEGVEVKLLYDAMGGRKLSKHFFDEFIQCGGEVSCFFPAIISHVNIRINYRNHRKIAVIDGKSGYIGGFNIGDEYLGKSKKFGYWRDTHLKIEGDAVNDLELRFLLDWNYATKGNVENTKQYFTEKSTDGTTGIQIVSSGPDSIEDQIKNGYLKMITSAKKYIYIQSPYFVPDDSIIEALRVASLCGVDVKIMLPNKPDHPFVYWASLSYAGDLLSSGVKVYKYEKGFIHSKTIVVDDYISSVGTANMDIRSFKLNFEINAFIYDNIVSSELKLIFEKDIQNSTEITETIYKNRSYCIKFKESISRLLSPIL